MVERKTFYIIDGHAQIYRAYFAPFRELTSPTGEPTKATFVFTQMLMNLADRRKPDYLAMVIDSGDESVFRKRIYPEYKANRAPRPEDLAPQEHRILSIVRDAGVPLFAKGGFEADDLIATICHQLRDRGFDVVIVSRDKDLCQLMGDGVRMYDVQAEEFFDADMLRRDYGYSPDKAVEIQTLTGDKIDNVPGIPGVGEKTAAKLIAQYGTAENVLAHADEMTPKMRENFLAHGEKLKLSRQLVTLKNDVAFDFDPEACRFNGLNAEALRSHLQLLGFTSLLKRLGMESSPPPAGGVLRPRPAPAVTQPGLFGDDSAVGETTDAGQTPENQPVATDLQTCAGCTYRLVQTDEQFADFLREIKQQKRFAFDTETDALGAMQSNLVGMSFSWQPATGWYVPVLGPSGVGHVPREKVLAELRPILEDPAVKKVGHNIKYDISVMRQAAVTVRGVELDSMVAAFLLDAGRMQYGIDRLALDMLHFRKIPTSDLIGKGKSQLSMQKVDLEKIAVYSAEDADIALRLANDLSARLDAAPALRKLADEVETPLIDVLVEMETNGIAVDPAVLKEQSAVLEVRIEELRKQIFQAAGAEFNIDSPRQLQEILFNKLNLPVGKRTKTGPSTDVEVLEKLADKHACPRLILDYRSLVKLKNTYLDNLTDFVNPRTGRIHASFNQIGAATGRLSCSDPNLQNIPIRTDEGRRIRLAFVPGDRQHNVLLTADYSQIELRIMAHLSQEPALRRAFDEDQDIHKAVAAEVFNVPLDQVTREQRGQAKTINFGILYGVSASGLSRRIEGLSVRAAQDLIDAYARRFPAIQRFLDQCVMQAQGQGYVETILGRRRPVAEIHSGVVRMRNAAERIAINSVVQGSAADLIKIAMNRVHRRLKSENRPSKLLLQVHDELVFETPADSVESEAEMVRHEMVHAMELSVPLKVEIAWGKNWQEAK